MRTPWLVHFSLNLLYLLNVKHRQYSHWNVPVMDICIVKTMNVVARIYDRFVGLAVCLEISSSKSISMKVSEIIIYIYMKIMWRDFSENSFESFHFIHFTHGFRFRSLHGSECNNSHFSIRREKLARKREPAWDRSFQPAGVRVGRYTDNT